MHTTHRTDPAPVAAALWAEVPGVATVRLSPVWTDTAGLPRRQTLVTLHDTLGRHLVADLGRHRAARDVVRGAFDLPDAEWNRQWVYTVASGTLAPPASFRPVDAAPRRQAPAAPRVLAVEVARSGGRWVTGRVRGAVASPPAARRLPALCLGGFLLERVAADGHRYYVRTGGAR